MNNVVQEVTQANGALAVLWDMDGTLVDSEPLHQRTLLAVLASVGVESGSDLFESTIGLSEGDVHSHCVDRFGLCIGASEWIAFRNAAYAREARALRPRPGALEAVRALASRGVAQAVVSNSSRPVLDISLGALQLQEALAVTVSRSDVRRGKPDPEPYLRAASLLRVAAADALVIEDSPTGAASGLAAGMRVLVWLPEGVLVGAFPAACHFVSTAADLAAFLSFNVQGAS
jgi:HAD superfamily hydrolase (TIGR01509 family)